MTRVFARHFKSSQKFGIHNSAHSNQSRQVNRLTITQHTPTNRVGGMKVETKTETEGRERGGGGREGGREGERERERERVGEVFASSQLR